MGRLFGLPLVCQMWRLLTLRLVTLRLKDPTNSPLHEFKVLVEMLPSFPFFLHIKRW